MSTIAIECHGLTKRFGAARAVEGIDLAVEQGESFGFLGPNGAGKTTTIRALLGLIRPTAGRCAVLGHDAWRDPVAVHRVVGSLSGDFRYDATLTGRELLHHLARLRGASDQALRDADELAERLQADLDRQLGDLSRGNHQKIGLIQAMFHRPSVLLLDEPTSGLDPLMQDEFVALIREVREAGTTVFLSSHNLTEVERTCERVAIIRAGQLVTTDLVDHLAERALRHVRVTFAGEAPAAEIAALPGTADLEVHGARATFRLAGQLDALTSLLARHVIADLSIERAGLDELFRSYYAAPNLD